MPNSAEDFWSIQYLDDNGTTKEVSLNQYAHGVTTWGAGRDVPTLRGEEPVYAYRVGQEFRPKSPEARTITLSMFVNGLNADGGYTAGEEYFKTNVAALRRLFWKPRKQVTLVRRWTMIDPDTGEKIQRVAGALAQANSKAELTMSGRSRAEMSVDFLLSDPYFYNMDTTTLSFKSTTETSMDIDNPGDDSVVQNFVITLQGPIAVTNNGGSPFIRLTNWSNPEGINHWVQYNAAIPEGQSVKIYVSVPVALQGPAPNFVDGTGLIAPDANITPTTGRLQYQGYAYPLCLFPTTEGTNKIEYTVSGDIDLVNTPADIRIEYREPYV